MEKKIYVAPAVEQTELQGEVLMQAVSGIKSDDLGIDFGGDASINDIHSADANRNNGWDLW